MACSDEHDECGHFADEDAENRIAMVRKRLRKLEEAKKEMRAPMLYGPQRAERTFVSFGSSYGPLREAVDRLNGRGEQANMLHFTDVWPLPAKKVRSALVAANRLVFVEGNATGQLERLLGTHTSAYVNQRIHRYDGRPFSPEYILDHLQ
jgi:2-oxoglutarate ferredoxin oxidoreductase subunit alpha